MYNVCYLIHTYVYTYICIYKYMYVYMYVYMYRMSKKKEGRISWKSLVGPDKEEDRVESLFNRVLYKITSDLLNESTELSYSDCRKVLQPNELMTRLLLNHYYDRGLISNCDFKRYLHYNCWNIGGKVVLEDLNLTHKDMVTLCSLYYIYIYIHTYLYIYIYIYI
jgi:hypothetical protein